MDKAKDIIPQLQQFLSAEQLLTGENDKAYYTRGFRVGHGKALAVAIPDSLLQLWHILKACVACDKIILMQASNTGVTGGSTPDGDDYDREVIIVSTRRIKGVQVIDDARQVIAFPGSTLTELEKALQPHQKEPHSVIGSSCIGASVVGGVCNNSGGSLIRRGPAFTEKSLFAQIDRDGTLSLVNHLGVDLGTTPEEMIARLEKQDYTTGTQSDWDGKIWADDYANVIRDVEADSPTRFNGNVQYLHDSAGSAGKVAVFAVRLSTFERGDETQTFYIGTNDEKELVALRRTLLQNLKELPQQAEYIHRNAFDLTVRYSKHVYWAVDRLGPESLPSLMAKKAQWDVRVKKAGFLPLNLVDKVLQKVNSLTPKRVAKRILNYRDQFEHHLMIKTEVRFAGELQRLLRQFFADNTGQFFACDEREEKDAFLVRFGVGGCTVSYCDYWGIDANERLMAFDVALRRNDDQWRIILPPHLQAQVLEDSCCGHFFCFVNHQDYILKPGVDPVAFKHEVLEYLDRRGAKYPAEHNVGHQYQASSDYEQHMRQLDPTNSCNPGIGKTSKNKYWA
ncbi:D-lactate dehydrogenase [Rouxiella chamberiensis]|uniref:Quinone-dependent D-lactate dehydrogenase n=1 Tax=Rouxiella chamberiensis TaxID=1513468 RepID=A0ABY7HTJ7_9GAMM|nr:D-lactate dehydrogenase [Rouxiella chamberiensis]WAT02379.1 D-lactate dehydrogenase [Rouxiella chamberiensis]